MRLVHAPCRIPTLYPHQIRRAHARMRRWALVGSAAAMSAATARMPGIAVFMIMMMIGIDLGMIDMLWVVNGVTFFFDL